MLEEFLPQLQQPIDKEKGLTLPLHPLRTRSLERYLDIGYHELHLGDIGELDTVIKCCEVFNFLLGKLPLGTSSEYVNNALNTMRASGDRYVKMSFRLEQGISALLSMERPAPGARFEEQLFLKTGDDEKKLV